MKYIKLYENITKPQVGDWVICKLDPDTIEESEKQYVENFFNNNVGEVIPSYGNISVRFYPISDEHKLTYKLFKKETMGDEEEFINIDSDEIVDFGTKEEMLIALQTNKYNL